MKSRQALKNTFHQGAIPQEQDYADLLDSYRHLSDPIPQSAVTGLETTLQSLSNPTAAEHSHDIDDVTNLQSALDGKAPTSHSHAIADTTGLQSALDGKAPTSHSHTLSDITDYTAPSAVGVTQVLTSGTKIATVAGTDIFAPPPSGWSNPETLVMDIPTSGSSAGRFEIGTLNRTKQNHFFVKANGSPTSIICNANKSQRGWQMVYAFFAAGCDDMTFTLTNFTKIGNFHTVQGRQYVLRLVAVNLYGSNAVEFAMAWLDACNCDDSDTTLSILT